MNFVMLHDNDGLCVLLNLEQVRSILELQDGRCSINLLVGGRKL